MKRKRALVLCTACLLGCTSMRVTGAVTDAVTGRVVTSCGITIGPKYVTTDPVGHYSVNAREWWNKMEVACLGYEPQTVMVDFSRTRYQKIDFQMVARRAARPARGETAAARTP